LAIFTVSAKLDDCPFKVAKLAQELTRFGIPGFKYPTIGVCYDSSILAQPQQGSLGIYAPLTLQAQAFRIPNPKLPVSRSQKVHPTITAFQERNRFDPIMIPPKKLLGRRIPEPDRTITTPAKPVVVG
jgi:hypothetical protein